MKLEAPESVMVEKKSIRSILNHYIVVLTTPEPLKLFT